MQYHYVLTLNIFLQDECFCSKLGMEEYANSNLNTSLSHIWVICQFLPFVSVHVGQITLLVLLQNALFVKIFVMWFMYIVRIPLPPPFPC